MPRQTSQSLVDLSDIVDAPRERFRAVLAGVDASLDEAELDRLLDAVTDRTLETLREGSRQDYLDEALVIYGTLESSAGEKLRAVRPAEFGRLSALADLLSAAGSRSGPVAAEAVLRSHATYGRPLLEYLARKSEPARRADIRHALEISESQLSHLLRDFDETDLVIRYRPEGGKEVMVELGPVGREVVDRTVLPPWLVHVCDRITTIKEGQFSVTDIETLQHDLIEKGAPSDVAAERLAKALAAIRPARRLAATREYTQGRMADRSGWSQRSNDLGGRRPRAQFTELEYAR